jgi:hypothetical protein
MAIYTTLSWQNENSLTSFPLAEPFDLENFLVDASFIQFDGFTPRLKKIKVFPEQLDVTILFDVGEVTSTYHKSSEAYCLRFYENSARFLGSITFGAGLQIMWASYLGQQLERDLPFYRHLVKSIPLKDAVYTLDSLYGEIEFDSLMDSSTIIALPNTLNSTLATGKTIFYNTDKAKENLTFNAVKNHAIYNNADKLKPLKKINLVKPIDNNVYLSSNDVIKFNSFNNKRLNITLVGESSDISMVPTLAN